MKKAVVDLTGCKYRRELHERFAKALEFPKHYGMNLDAFWDCINVDCQVNFVTVIGVKTLPADVRKEANIMIELLEENKRDWAHVDPPFDYKIEG